MALNITVTQLGHNITVAADGKSITVAPVTTSVTTATDVVYETPVTSHTALTNIGTNTHAEIDTHIADVTNPHSVTATQLSLGNVDNTTDLLKPISTATQTALDLKSDTTHTHTKSDITDFVETDYATGAEGDLATTALQNVIEDLTPQLGGTLDANNNIINNITSLQLAGGTGAQGTLSWNTDEETIDVVLNGSTLQMGQEMHIHVRNNTGVTLTDGTAVMATGTLGESGRITVGKMDGTDPTNAKYFLGILTEDIINGDDGKLTTFGKIRQINTSGSPYGETWADGDVIWIDTSTAGDLTNADPANSALALPIAFVISAHATTGTLFVRSNTLDLNAYATAAQGTLADSALQDITSESLSTLGDVTITTNTSGELLKWNGTAWINNTLSEAGIATAAEGDLATSALQNINSENIDDLNDVIITTPSSTEVLQYNGTNWVNVAASAVGVTDHVNLDNIGTNTHAQIDTHIADATKHFTQASISITESQISDLQPYIFNISNESISDLIDTYLDEAYKGRYWQVYVDETDVPGTSYTIIAEITMDISNTDQTGSGTASASGFFDGTTVPAKAFDNTTSTVWKVAGDTDNWITYDFGVGQRPAIDQIKISASNSGSEVAGAPGDFRIRVSDDNSNWTTVQTVVGEAWDTGETSTFNTFNVLTPTDGQVLTYDTATSEWIASTATDTTDHTALSNIGTNTHAQIDTHIADGTVHFTESSISITESQISDLGTYIPSSEKAAANGVATLGADSKIPSSQLPAIAITSTSEVANEAAQLALTAEEGDVAVRSDENKSYIHNGGVAGTMADWTLLATPTDAVLSVDGNTGAVSLSGTYAPLSHTHTESDITDLQSYLLNITGESISSLSDVLTSMTPVDGQVLTYDTTNGWQAETTPAGVTDHTLLSNIGTNSHAQLDTHLANSAMHFTEASINITKSQVSDFVETDYATGAEGDLATSALQNITAESIKSLSDVFSTMTPTDGQVLTYDTTNGWQSETPVDNDTTDHTALSNIGTNTHAQIDTHIADGTKHFTQAAISITESQISDLQSYSVDTHSHTYPGTVYSGRYWQIFVDNNDGDAQFVGIAEIEFAESPGGADATGSGTITVSSETTPGFEKENAFDNITGAGNGWFTLSGDIIGAWITYDFGAGNDKSIVEMRMTAFDDVAYTDAMPKDFKIRVSDDNTTWTEVLVTTNNTAWSTSEERTFDGFNAQPLTDGQVLTYDLSTTQWYGDDVVPVITDHTALSNIGTNTHAQIDTHIADSTVHFTESSISITESQISDLGTYIPSSEKASANGVATLDGTSKIPTSQLPALALTDINTVANEAAQLALTAQEGDVAIRTDLNKSYAHNGGVAGTMADWSELLTPTDAVLSVDGRTGAVTLSDLYSAIAHNHNADYAAIIHAHTKSDITDFAEADYATGAEGDLATSALQNITAESIKDLSDVFSAMTPTQYQVLSYDITQGWRNLSFSHVDLTNVGTNTHAQIDTHIADSTVHFTQAAISITKSQVSDFVETDYATGAEGDLATSALQNITAESIKSLSDVFSTMIPTDGQVLTYDTTNGWQSETLVDNDTTDHTALSNIGTNTHAQIDTHIADGTKHFTQAAISITESQISDLGTYLTDITGEPLTDLSDIPTITGNAGKLLKVNATADGYLWGDPAGTTVSWGDIAGTLSNQTDLQTALNGKSSTTHTHTKSDITDFVETDYATGAEGDLATSALQNITAESIGDLTNVVLTTPASTNILQYNGVNWVNVAESTVGLTDHTALSNIGSNTHAQIDTHIADATKHFTQAAISITESQISDLGTYLTDITGEALSTLSDVTITTNTSGELLKWNGTAWINNTLTEAGIAAESHTHVKSEITDFTEADYVHVTGAESIGGNKTFSNDVVVTGNLTVNGTTLTVNTTELTISDNIITLNNDEAGTPTQNAGIEVERGTSTNASLIWDETADVWKAGITGSEVELSLTTHTHVEADITDLDKYTQAEVDALTWDASDIVSGTFANARIAASNVTQHQAAISITESQISDLDKYTQAEVNAMFDDGTF